MKIFFRRLVFTLAVSAFAQAPVPEIRVVGEHRIAGGDTPESAKQIALIDATRKAWQEAVTRLQAAGEVKALQLNPEQLGAFVASTLEVEEESSRESQGVYTVNGRAQLDTVSTARRFARLRKDQETTYGILETWQQMQELIQQLPKALTNVRAKHLAVQVSAALAKTEESLGSSRVPLAEGQARAKRLAQQALALTPDTPDAHYAMGDVLIDAEEAGTAAAEYRKALAANPNSASGHTKLANALRLDGKLDEAIVELREALRINPDSPSTHTDLGIILGAQSKSEDAIAEYREALRLDRDFIDAHNNLAIALARQRQIKDAVVEFREIVRIDPDSALGYYNLAIALADMDQDQESAAALREVVRINPNHYNARFNIGELFRLENKYDEAVGQFREYLRLAPDTPQNQRNIRRAKDFIQSHENK